MISYHVFGHYAHHLIFLFFNHIAIRAFNLNFVRNLLVTILADPSQDQYDESAENSFFDSRYALSNRKLRFNLPDLGF